MKYLTIKKKFAALIGMALLAASFASHALAAGTATSGEANRLPELIEPLPPVLESLPMAPTVSGDKVKQFGLTLTQKDGVITAKVSDAFEREVELKLFSGAKVIEKRSLIGNGSAAFSKHGDGVYVVRAAYVTPLEGVTAVEKKIEIKGTGSTGSLSGEKKPTVSKIGAKVTSGENWIEVSVTDADDWPMYVAIGDEVRMVGLGGRVRLDQLAAGQYDIEVDYVEPVSGVSPFRSSVTIKNAKAKEIIFGASGGTRCVEVIVTEASVLPIRVELKKGSKTVAKQMIAGGVGKVEFTGLDAGEYSVSVNYDPAQSGVSARQQTGIIVAGKAAQIKITSVKAGENVIAVSGTAQPNADIALTTTPSAPAACIVRCDAKGAFTGKIVLPAGTYTQVRATYVADNAVSAALSGQYVVTAPASKPTLTVDPVNNTSRQVLAQTQPGVTVNLRVKAYNYGQTLAADNRGLLRFSLPQTYPKGTVFTFTVYYGKDNAQNYQQTVTVGKKKTYDTLSYGDTGDDVEELTDRLEDLGYLPDETRRYSSEVREAIKTFQRINGLEVDGIAGHETQEALFSVTAIAYGGEGTYGTLTRGDKGSTVSRLQKRLKQLGYYAIAVDGVFGSGTERSVRHFQRINGLPKTGVADEATQKLLYSSSAKAADSAAAEDYKELSRSNTYHAAVVPLQRRLKALGYAVGTADGYFGSQTLRAVREFQRRNGLKVTGVADEEMQRRLFSSAAIGASGYSSSSSWDEGEYRLLTWGSTGEDVKRLQKALLSAGYKQVRVADGIYGQWTYDAVRAFQKDHRLEVDGIAGRKTQNALYGTNY